MSAARLTFVAIFVLLGGLAVWLLLDDPKGEGRGDRGGRAVTVVAEKIVAREFADIVEALGNARARESVVISPRVTDTVAAIYFDDGNVVKGGDLLFELTSDEEKADLSEADANIIEAERNLARVRDLVARGNASSATQDEAERRLAEATARKQAAMARLADQQIKAPFDGLLGLRMVSEGSLVTQSTAVTTIDAIDIIKLDFQVPERFISVLRTGQTVEARVDAYPGRVFAGEVQTIDSRVDPATRSVIVRAEIKNEDLSLRPGMLMSVEVTSRVWRGLALPEEAVVPTAGRDYVFVVSGDTVDRRAVELGARRPGYVEALSGVEAGEQVVTQGTQRLGRPGLAIRVLDRKSQGENQVQSAATGGNTP